MPTSHMKIRWDFTSMKWEGLTREQIELWERLYPRADVIQALKVDIPRWFDKWKGTKKVRKVRFDRFIANWLKRDEEVRI